MVTFTDLGLATATAPQCQIGKHNLTEFYHCDSQSGSTITVIIFPKVV